MCALCIKRNKKATECGEIGTGKCLFARAGKRLCS